MNRFQKLIPLVAVAAVLASAPASAAEQAPTVKFSTCKKPIYPAEAIRAQRVGTVQLGFHIGAGGELLESKIEKTSGHRDLDEAALQAIKLCSFNPATQDGMPVKEWATVRYVWSLK